MSKAQQSEERQVVATGVTAKSPGGDAVAKAGCNSRRRNISITYGSEFVRLERIQQANRDTDFLCSNRLVCASSGDRFVERAMVLPSVHASSTSRIVSPSNIGTVGCEKT